MSKIDLSLVVAMTPEHIIGNNGKLPWKQLPSDLFRFKNITMQAGTVIMGRKTFVSILTRNGKPLPERKHIILSKENISCPDPLMQCARFVKSPEEACAEVAENGGHACVIGGGEIFKLFLPRPEVTKVYITLVHAKLHGDVYFPEMSEEMWRCIGSSKVLRWNPLDEYETSLVAYERRS